MTELGGDVDSPSKNDTYTPKAHTRKKLIAQQRRYARVYKGIGETSVTFFGKGGARERAEVFLDKEKRSKAYFAPTRLSKNLWFSNNGELSEGTPL